MYLIDHTHFAVPSSFFAAIIVAMAVAVIIMVFYIVGVSEALGAVMSLQTYYHLIWMMYMTGISAIVLNGAGGNFEAVCAGVSLTIFDFLNLDKKWRKTD